MRRSMVVGLFLVLMLGLAAPAWAQATQTTEAFTATPAAQAAYNYAQEKNIPVIYTAVTDTVGASLANADKTNPGHITGTSDLLAVEAQLKMIRALMPEDGEVAGLLALMLLTEARRTARVSASGELVALDEQDWGPGTRR